MPLGKNSMVKTIQAVYRSVKYIIGIDSNIPGHATCKHTTFDDDEILNNHKSFMPSLNIETKCEDLPYLYWILKLYKNQ